MARGSWFNIVEIIDGETYYFVKGIGYHDVGIYMLDNFITNNGYTPFLNLDHLHGDSLMVEAANIVFDKYDIRKLNGRRELNNRDKQRLKRIIAKTLESRLASIDG